MEIRSRFAAQSQLALSWQQQQHCCGSSTKGTAAAAAAAADQPSSSPSSCAQLWLGTDWAEKFYVVYSMYVPSSTLAPYYRRTTAPAPATRRHRGALRGPLPARRAAGDQRQQWCRGEWVRKQLWLLNLVAVVGSSSSPAWRHSPPPVAVAAVVVGAVGLETVVNVVVQLGSAGHTAAAACAAPSIPLLLRAPRRPSILLQPQCRIQEDSCHSTAAARPLCRRRRRRAIGAACKLATRPTVEKNMPSYHLPICLRAARCGAVRRGCRYWISG